uniref:Uncharacterized protein n=1 Tax=Chromera velia CCMP2878 TaxID=1169474 RepID=A0A0G4FQK5_9ALVE|eukprot:Cvel_18091.t1-p1 / transcript=Cvel_18091.t1 / gene=Cvel_18091 / organism=Chromera_velia_CCMP2878 / gene_product=hypothetical protein / transcript_product=hypothetical protein / location=Cvel_scaffold1482:3700-4317(-) / protein_length=206 / sequence_SO=supercontig / SO=protein_coding / is_pseudo=false
MACYAITILPMVHKLWARPRSRTQPTAPASGPLTPPASPPGPPTQGEASETRTEAVQGMTEHNWLDTADHWTPEGGNENADPPTKYWYQLWYADDSSCTSWLTQVRAWLRRLLALGPAAGYEVETDKCFLVVPTRFHEEARRIFAEYPAIKIVSGARLLGGHIGEGTHRQEWLSERVGEWQGSVERMAEAAEFAPHEAYTAYTLSL